MNPRADRRAVACAAAAAVLLAVSAPRLYEAARSARAMISVSHAELGHALRTGDHAAALDPSFRLPLGPLLEAGLLLDRPAAAPWAFALAALATGALAGAAGAVLGGAAAGAAAAGVALLVLAGLPKPPGFLKMLFYTPFVLLPALALALRARRPGPAADWTVGLAFAAGLLYRSTLFFLPLLLAAYELARGRDRRSALSAGRLLLPCALAVLPWAWMNARVHGTPTPFERGASDMLVVGGVLGMTDTTPEGDRRALAPDAPEGPGILRWAARRVAASPFAYAAAVCRRLWFAAGLMPLLLLAAAAGFWRARRDPAARALAVFAGYFLGVHALLATLPYYYEPLWPALAALAAGLLAGPKPDAKAARAAGVVLITCLAPALALATMAAAASARYAVVRGAPGAPQDDALSRWRRARRAIETGRPADALPELDAALAAAPDLPRLAAERARAEEALGRAGATGELAARLTSAPFGDDPRLDLRLWQAVFARERGEDAAAKAALSEAAALWRADQRLTVARTPAEKAWQDRLRASADESLGRRAEASFEEADPRRWATALADAALAAAPAAARAPLLRLQAEGAYAEACPRLARLAALLPSARAETDRGVCAYLAGRPAEAAAAFRRALALDPSSAEARSSLDAATAALPKR
ncbi:MAG: hypothetical protein SF051_15310 [Elusimicrobiota bacterium]|nr:hypothetical protein [Elusimicrobiota bacterium]